MKTLKFHNPESKQAEREVGINIQIRTKTMKLLRFFHPLLRCLFTVILNIWRIILISYFLH